ncbi:hypothetical protein ACFL3T_05045 [Patescibacteria group bacterium]
MELDTVPSSIPESKTKKALLDKAEVDSLYLGQGLMFVPPEEAVEEYNELLRQQGGDPNALPLSVIQQKGKAGDPYNSPTLDNVWRSMQNEQFRGGFRTNEAFGQFVHEQARETMRRLFEVDPETIATIQVDNLMQALARMQTIVPKLMGKPISRVVLPAKYKYSGHTEFVDDCQLKGGDMEIVEIPEVQIDGEQDLESIWVAFKEIQREGRVGLFIDQERNNNASGFDRDTKLNPELSGILEEFKDHIVYFGDIAYKGLKGDVLEPYPLMQQLIDDGVTAFFYTSFSKTGNYRGTPSYKNTLTGTPGELADTDKLRKAFAGAQRAAGIGTNPDGAKLMSKLSGNLGFLQEVQVLNQYLGYVRDRVNAALQGTDLAPLFGDNTSGIFRCLPPEIAGGLNAGENQIVTVGERINIWPLGDPMHKDFFVKKVMQVLDQ